MTYINKLEIPAVQGKADNQGGQPGLHHMQLRHAGLDHLFARYEALGACGILQEELVCIE